MALSAILEGKVRHALFGKNEQVDLCDDEKKILKILSDEYSRYTKQDIEKALRNKQFKEVCCDK